MGGWFLVIIYFFALVWGEIALISGAIENISRNYATAGAAYIVGAIFYFMFMTVVGKVLAAILD
jgi:hypothetical protein